MAKRPKDPDYEVGYGRPPRSGQFKPGQSGNPKGRPPKTKDIQEIIKDTLFSPMTIRANGRARTVPKIQAFLMLLVTDALKGDSSAAARLIRLLPLAAKTQAAEVASQQHAEQEDLPSSQSELDRTLLQHFVEMAKDGAFSLDGEGDA